MFTTNEKIYLFLSLNLLSFKCSHAQDLWFLLLPLSSNWYAPAKDREKEINTEEFSIEKKEKKSSLKFVGRNQNAICFIMFYFSPCKSQEDCSSWFTKRRVKDKKCKHTISSNAKTLVQIQSKVQGCIQSKTMPNWILTAVIKPNATRCQALSNWVAKHKQVSKAN